MDKSTKEIMLEIVQGFRLARTAVENAQDTPKVMAWMARCKVTPEELEALGGELDNVLDAVWQNGQLAHCESEGFRT